MTGRVFLALGFALFIATGNAAPSIILQSTTSTQNSGLYDYLLPKFRQDAGIAVNVVAVGTGQAIKNAQNCDGDVLLVHARSAEEAFIAAGYGVERFDVMYNDFVIVGPPADPAGIRGLGNAVEGLGRISASGSIFLSRGDNSGTHKKELALWLQAGVKPEEVSGQWYRETGSGMGATLNVAVEMNGYTLTDRGTWISFGNKKDFQVLLEGDSQLFNQYGVMMVNPKRCNRVDAEAAQTFIDWLLSPRGQQAIAAYQLLGQPLFVPNAK